MGRPILKRRHNISWITGSAIALILLLPHLADATFKKETPNSCINCHQTQPDQRLSQPVTLWSASVHAEVGNTCDGCHGGNPDDTTMNSMSKENNFYAAPKEEDIVQFCGKCHRELADNFMTSQHGVTGTQNCIGCHGSHTIRRISIDIINEKTCTECHDYEQPQKLRTILEALHGHFRASKDKVNQITGFPTGSLNKEMDKIWNQLRQVRMISHTFDVAKVQASSEKVEVELKQTDMEITRLLDLEKDRKYWGYTAIIVFLFLALATHLYNKPDEN